jgi:lysozyme
MRTSPAGRALIQAAESCKLEAYPDPGVGWKLPTIGWGHTGPDVVRGLKIGQAIADELFDSDVLAKEGLVLAAVHRAPLTQGQFDALVSFAYNCAGWQNSTLVRMVNEGNFTAAADEFPKWCHADGRVLPGLVTRRAAERAMFLGEAA